MTRFPDLFSEGKIGSLRLKNRIIFPPMVTRYSSETGSITQQLLDYYYERSAGGCGLVIVEAAYPRAGGYPGRIYVDKDEVIPDLRKLAEVIHKGGAKAALQINAHRGRSDEVDPASATETTNPQTGVRARGLTASDIKRLVDDFGAGSRRAKDAGFDAMMIHGGTGYLVTEFLSPRTNKRTDKYGGNTRNRARLALDLVAAAREATGPQYPIIFRLTADDKIENGFGVEDAVEVSKLLEEAGVDAIDIVSGVAETFHWAIPHMYMPRGCNIELSHAVKQAVGIPVSVAGNINDPNLAEAILREGKADFVDFGRALAADPWLPKKARTGNLDGLRKCLSCCRCIEDLLVPPGKPLICSVNPAVGKEKEFATGMTTAAKKKKVLVIGGGPGGMQAAVTAAQRGHDVTIWEKQNRLGGQLNLAVIPPGKDRLNCLTEYLIHQLNECKIDVELQREADESLITDFAPDSIVIAVGAKPRIPEIRGREKKKPIYFADVLLGRVSVGNKIAIVGGGYIGCEVADFLLSKGKHVSVRTSMAHIADDVFYPYGNLIRERLNRNDVHSIPNVVDEQIEMDGLRVTDKEGKQIFIEADDIVLCTGFESDRSLSNTLNREQFQLFEVGDCVEPRRIYEAVSEGAQAGLQI